MNCTTADNGERELHASNAHQAIQDIATAPHRTATASPDRQPLIARPAVVARPAGATAASYVPSPVCPYLGRPANGPRYASFLNRAIAAVIDGFVLQVAFLLIDGFFIGALLRDLSTTSILMATIGPAVASCIVTLIYCVWLESSPWQATLGKKILGLKVVDVDGERITFGRSSKRNLAKTLSTLTLGFGYLMPLWNHRRQALHDKASGCFVVHAT